MQKITNLFKDRYVRFVLVFLGLYFLLYYFNIAFIGITAKGGFYIPFLDQHLNYIRWWRNFTIQGTAFFLRGFGFNVLVSKYDLIVIGRHGFRLVYDCLGYGVMSAFSAFVIAYPEKKISSKLIFMFFGLISIQSLNFLRLVLLALFWKKTNNVYIDHHSIFNAVIYLILIIIIYFWLNHGRNATQKSIR